MSRRTVVNAGIVLVVVLLTAALGVALLREQGGPTAGTTAAAARPATTAPQNQLVDQVRRRTRAAVSPWRADSASGAFVELIGVENYRGDAKTWWKPDGSPMEQPRPELRANSNNQRRLPTRLAIYRIFIRAGIGQQQVRIDPKMQESGQWLTSTLVRGDNQFQGILIEVPESWQQLNLGISVTLPGDGSPVFHDSGSDLRVEHVHDFQSKGYLKLSPIMELPGIGTEILVSYFAGPMGSVFENSSILRSARTIDGRTIVGRSFRSGDRYQSDFVSRWLFDVRPEEIASISCRARACEYAEFRGISLEQGKATTVKVTPLAPGGMDLQPIPNGAAPATAPATNPTVLRVGP